MFRMPFSDKSEKVFVKIVIDIHAPTAIDYCCYELK